MADLQQRAEAGDAQAQSDLGLAYAEGDGVARDFAEAAMWFRKAAEQGNPSGENRLGVLFERGAGVPKDDVRAIEWYRRAADHGYVVAQRNMAAHYDAGVGVQRDFVQSAMWYRKAAEQGDLPSQFNLAMAYVLGQGVTKDIQEAHSWFTKASAQQYAPGTFYLGKLHWDGMVYGGTMLSATVGIETFGKAAAQGYPLAALVLAKIYSSRNPYVSRDAVEACKWTMVANALDRRGEWNEMEADTAEVHRDLPRQTQTIRKGLTPQQVTECERHAAEWLAANPERAAR